MYCLTRHKYLARLTMKLKKRRKKEEEKKKRNITRRSDDSFQKEAYVTFFSWFLIFRGERKSFRGGEERRQRDHGVERRREKERENGSRTIGWRKRFETRAATGEGPGTLAVKKGKHTLKELTVIRPPEKLLVAWPLHGEQEKTRDVIPVNTAASSCSPALTRNHFVFLFTREMNEKGGYR